MEIVAARFPGVERCDMERIARWARRSPRSTLGAWPDAQLLQMPPVGKRRLAETPICGCAADVEAVYLTLLDHHVLEVVRSATPESFTDRVIRLTSTLLGPSGRLSQTPRRCGACKASPQMRGTGMSCGSSTARRTAAKKPGRP